jgi:hypothetical protein
MNKENQYAAEALEYIASIESALATYNTVNAAMAEHRRKLDVAEENERNILAEVDSDIEDAAERLVMAGALVRILSARSDDGKVKRALEVG